MRLSPSARSQCSHRRHRKLLAKAWWTWACNPSTGPACAGMLHSAVSRERCGLFSNAIELVDAVTNSTGCVCDPTAVLRPAAMESHDDFDNHAG